MNAGQTFSITDYRSKRFHIRRILKEKLTRRLRSDYYVNVLDIYFDELNFDTEINQINLLRTISLIINEKAEHEKTTQITIAETNLQVNKLKNEAYLVLETAKSKTENEVLKIVEKDAEVKIEFENLQGMSKNMQDLNFYKNSGATQPKDTLQRIISYCYLTSLIHSNNVTMISPGKYGVSTTGTALPPFIGLVNRYST